MTATTAEEPRERQEQRPKARRQTAWGRKTVRHPTLIVVLLISVGPMLWELSTSLKGKAEDVFTQNIHLLPQHPTLGNYGEVQRTIPVWHFAVNSLSVAAINVTGNVIGATLAG